MWDRLTHLLVRALKGREVLLLNEIRQTQDAARAGAAFFSFDCCPKWRQGLVQLLAQRLPGHAVTRSLPVAFSFCEQILRASGCPGYRLAVLHLLGREHRADRDLYLRLESSELCGESGRIVLQQGSDLGCIGHPHPKPARQHGAEQLHGLLDDLLMP